MGNKKTKTTSTQNEIHSCYCCPCRLYQRRRILVDCRTNKLPCWTCRRDRNATRWDVQGNGHQRKRSPFLERSHYRHRVLRLSPRLQTPRTLVERSRGRLQPR